MYTTYERKVVRAAAILTTSYVAGTVLNDLEAYNQLYLYVAFTIGSLTDAQIKVEFSDDGVTYYQEAFGAVSGGTETDTVGVHKLAATGNYCIPIPIKCSKIKVSSIGTGTVDNSSLAINAVYGVS